MIMAVFILMLICPILCLGAGADSRLFGGVAATTGENGVVCIGWPNNDCVPTGEGSEIYSINAVDKGTYSITWTATTNATIKAILINTYNYSVGPQETRLVVYKHNSTSDEWEPICYDELSQLWDIFVADGWTRFPIDTGTCTFSTGDDIRYGFEIKTDGGWFKYRRNDTGTGRTYYYGYNDPVANIDDSLFVTVTDVQPGIMLEYEVD